MATRPFSPTASRTDHAWLPAVIPADARRFRVADPDLARTLADAGAELVDGAADVKIAPLDELEALADYAVVTLDASQQEGGTGRTRARRRVTGHLRIRYGVARTRGGLRRRGYRSTRVYAWDIGLALRLPGVEAPPRPLGLAERLPQRAVVVGIRSTPRRTVVEAALAEARDRTGAALPPVWPLAKGGLMLVVSDGGVVRVAVGPARHRISGQLAALAALETADPPAAVAERVPWSLATGANGLAEWSAERRLPGTTASQALEGRLAADCLEFLVALNSSGTGEGDGASLSACAEVVAAARGGAAARAVRALGERLDAELADVPRGFGHGDFWHGNVLAEDGRLAGVVDWDSAGPGRLPLLDVLHLRLIAQRPRARRFWGSTLVDVMLPWSAAGGDDFTRAYARRLDLAVSPPRLRTFVEAYWLDRVAYQLRTYADRTSRPLWLRHNVDDVLRALTGEPI